MVRRFFFFFLSSPRTFKSLRLGSHLVQPYLIIIPLKLCPFAGIYSIVISYLFEHANEVRWRAAASASLKNTHRAAQEWLPLPLCSPRE